MRRRAPARLAQTGGSPCGRPSRGRAAGGVCARATTRHWCALEDSAERHGFELNMVRAETLLPHAQLAVAVRTDVLLAMHGNRLTYLLMMPPGAHATVVEIFFPDGFVHDYSRRSVPQVLHSRSAKIVHHVNSYSNGFVRSAWPIPCALGAYPHSQSIYHFAGGAPASSRSANLSSSLSYPRSNGSGG
jgi:hypothetical protein